LGRPNGRPSFRRRGMPAARILSDFLNRANSLPLAACGRVRPSPKSGGLIDRQRIDHPGERTLRPSRRQPDELRAISLEGGGVNEQEGYCFVKCGGTRLLGPATLEDRLPPWLKGQARGWITAEYGMLPRATLERTRREASAGKQNGRTVEIQRLIGRSLRT